MRGVGKLFSVIASFLISLPAHAIQSKRPEEFVLCKNHKIVRTIRVSKSPDKKSWVTFYTKGGLDREVGRGQSVAANLEILKNIQTNLEKAGWNCRDVDNGEVLQAQDND